MLARLWEAGTQQLVLVCVSHALQRQRLLLNYCQEGLGPRWLVALQCLQDLSQLFQGESGPAVGTRASGSSRSGAAPWRRTRCEPGAGRGSAL